MVDKSTSSELLVFTFKQILMMDDGRSWWLDVYVVCDVIVSIHGRVGISKLWIVGTNNSADPFMFLQKLTEIIYEETKSYYFFIIIAFPRSYDMYEWEVFKFKSKQFFLCFSCEKFCSIIDQKQLHYSYFIIIQVDFCFGRTNTGCIS